MPWFNNDWQYRKKITIDNTKVPAAQSNFPVYYKVTDNDLRHTGSGGHVGKVNGGDIVFTASDGTTQLDHEICSYDDTTGALEAWVKVISLLSSVDTDIYIYYGYAGAADQWDLANLWAEYEHVWHLQEDGDGTADEFKDAIGGIHGQGGGGNGAATPTRVTGKIHSYAQDFDGGDWIDLGTGDRLPAMNTLYTISFWVNIDAKSGVNSELYIVGSGSGGAPRWNVMLGTYTPDNSHPNMITYDTGYGGAAADTDIPINTWKHVLLSKAGDDTVSFFVDGVADGTDSHDDHGTISGSSAQLIGAQLDSWGHINGTLEEVRIMVDDNKGVNWALTEFNNQDSPATFYSTGSEETGAQSEQEGFRFRNDDGSESAATWKAAQDTDINIPKDKNFRIRIIVDSSGDLPSQQYQLEYKETADPASQWRKVPLT